MPEITADRLLPSAWPALGPHWDGRGTHFAVFSEQAERIELCLFDNPGRHETRLLLPECSDGVWRGYLPGAGPGTLYGYRAYGPYDPARGLRFNNHKLLLDPYARQLRGELRWHDALYGYRIGHGRADLSYDRRNSADYLPKAVVADDRYEWDGDHPPRVPWSETVIYELHLKGWSRLNERIPSRERGTFGALGHPASIDYLRRLGVTAVELLPIHAFARDRALLERGLANYWGYNTLAYFAPEPSYLSDGTSGQLKWAVQRLHAAGIEVILDVVYNHTCEGNELGPTLCWRGLDNASYYRLAADDPRHYVDDTGCGNTVNLSHPRVIQMVMDSLRWWAGEYHVDGFRFDLGATLGREPQGFDPGCGLFDALLQDPLLGGLKLISEPWDLGPGGYQLGRHPPGFAEWNDKFRSCVRRYWRGDSGMRGALAAVLQGTAELFDHGRRRPWASVNFVTAHDGFTLRDLVSYEAKHNEDNGEDNRDGSDYNDSRNWGAEGPTDDAGVESLRRRAQRSLLCSLFLSHGTPMLLAGDELGRSQQGNNNAYCQDNELSWLDWRQAESAEGLALFDFVARLIRIRREHPVFQGPYFQHGVVEPAPGLKDIFWFDERGNELPPADWDNPNARLLGVRRALARGDGRLEVAILLFNADEADHDFELPPPALDYQLLAASEDPDDSGQKLEQGRLSLRAYSAAVLLAQPMAEQLHQPPPQKQPQNDAQPAGDTTRAAA
jgi:isoamylase